MTTVETHKWRLFRATSDDRKEDTDMGTFSCLEEAREYFRGDRFATENGMVLEELTDEYAVCSVELKQSHRNAQGGIMGGVMFTLADLAFAALSNNIHNPTVAQQVSVNFLGAPKGTKLIARAVCRKSGRSSIIINVDIADDMGRDIAQFIGTGFKL